VKSTSTQQSKEKDNQAFGAIRTLRSKEVSCCISTAQTTWPSGSVQIKILRLNF